MENEKVEPVRIQRQGIIMTKTINRTNYFLVFIFFFIVFSSSVNSEEKSTSYKPFILANTVKISLNEATTQVKDKLSKAGFTIVGEFSPYQNTTLLIITNDVLKNVASQSYLGGFGVAQRVSLTQVNGEVQISYTNPIYMAHVYRMKQDLKNIAAQLATALGMKKAYGPETGLAKADLRKYQYKWLMPHFSDSIDLASYSSQEIALKKINALFNKGQSGVNKIYQIDLPNKEETIIGVNMTGAKGNDCSGDEYIMSRIDFKEIKSSGHLPYEIVISKGKVVTLPAEFRIAINFPDLSMMGDNSFMSIMCAPEAIQAALTAAVGGELAD